MAILDAFEGALGSLASGGGGPATIDTPLGAHTRFHSMGGIEGLSRPFAYEIDVTSDRSDIAASELLGQSVTVHLTMPGADARHWNGHVTALTYVETSDDGVSRYRLIVRPWLWQLSQSADCRIFQRRSIPEIVTQIFEGRGFTDFEESLFGDYQAQDYVVQYRETDLDFITRLLEREGIYYFFRHDDGKHTLVLADSASAHAAAPGCDKLPFAGDDEHRDATMEYVRSWKAEALLQTGTYAQTDYDFTKPQVPLLARASATDDDAAADLEVYDHPGGFDNFADADAITRLRLAQARRDADRRVGETNARGFSVGTTFALTDHPRESENQEYLVTSARVRLKGQDAGSASDDEDPSTITFVCIDADDTFRPPRVTPKPIMRGPQTAVVVGPDGQDIWTDQYGRVKVQFHWDRVGERDENSSCWIRVAQVWAGMGWGGQFIPRVGQEVIVDFLEGDPDRPIITGSVYNGSNGPAFDLPGNQTQSGFKTRSTPGGSMLNGNEIRFEDMKGSEELFIKAEKTQTTLVKGSQTVTVAGLQVVTVGAGQTETVGGGRSTVIGADDSTTVAQGQILEVGGARRVLTRGASDERIEGGSNRSVGGPIVDQVLGGRTIDTVGPVAEHVVGSKTETIDFQHTVSVGGGLTTHVTGNSRHSVDGGWSANIGLGATPASASVTVNGDVTVGATGQITIRGDKQLVLQCGTTSLTLTPDTLSLLAETLKLTAKTALQAVAKSSAMKLADAVDVVAPKVNLMSQSASLHLDSAATLVGSSVKLGSGSGSSNSSSSSSDQANTTQFSTKILDDAGKPIAGKAYVLIASGQRFTGTTGGDGSVTATIPKGVDTLHLRITMADGPPPSYVNFALSAVEPPAASTPEGLIARLQNLGYLATAQPDAATLRDAISRFQRDASVPVTGELDGPTTSALQDAHGH